MGYSGLCATRYATRSSATVGQCRGLGVGYSGLAIVVYRWVVRYDIRYDIPLGGSVTVGHSGWCATGSSPIPTSCVDTEMSTSTPQVGDARSTFITIPCGSRAHDTRQRLTRSDASGSHLPSIHLSSSIVGRYGFLDGFQYPTHRTRRPREPFPQRIPR